MMPSLKTILRMNAASCIGFGGLFVMAPRTVAAFLASTPAPKMLVAVLGAALILNGLHLLHTSLRTATPRWLVLYFSAGDFLWVTITAALVAAGLWITTWPGILAAVAVALAVGGLGLGQILKLPAPAPQRGSTTQ